MTYSLSIPHGSQNARTLHLLKLLYNYYITLCNLHCIHIIVYCNLHCIYMWLCLFVRMGLCVCIVLIKISVCIPVKWLIRGHIIRICQTHAGCPKGRENVMSCQTGYTNAALSSHIITVETAASLPFTTFFIFHSSSFFLDHSSKLWV